ncbi:AMP-dependent synthetase and ligase [Alkalidesulfovibrio alkalitolerans DSM 16529]|uniref:Phenylacetate-coenzyme A ligase n=1 Tax=Alkalidesulfovibrio alkalitolerans DSM 16529 TaxID=1121439 RepID=S7TCK2_9BACT|nr:phenylacetate--CoA ligase [Alkalidesulfovibrio alkalitolerans]EPR34381.1 AMP-dependent synthetase and ligase [Alkalidesulfovibrio alkalitolerans DSM 16529]
MYYDPEYERMDRDTLEGVQLERLQSTLNRVARNVPLYRTRFDEMGFEPDDVRTLDDLAKLPFTTKADLRENYPYGLFAVPLREVVRLQASSGTTGKPTVVGYTKNDIARWAGLAARLLVAGGVTRDDLVQVAFHYGLFTGGFGFHYGCEALGASVIPASSGGSKRQVMVMQDYRTTALVCTPSYALHLADVMDETGVNPNALSLRFGLFGAETWSEAMRREIEQRLKLTATDNYGISEVMGPGVAGECLERSGLHLNEDHFLAEIVDPDTGAPLPPGEKGELVLTTLTKEAFPVIRYRTGDLTRFIDGPCPCGRTLRRIDRIIGRTDDMLTVRGINVFPSQVEAILLEVIHGQGGAQPHYQIVIERDESHLDQAQVLVEAEEEAIVSGSIGAQQDLIRKIERRLSSDLGVAFKVRLVEPRSLERSEGKANRVLDKRAK